MTKVSFHNAGRNYAGAHQALRAGVRSVLGAVLLCGFGLGTATRGWGAEYYVSPSGNDTWTGRFSTPNAEAKDGPFRTLTCAAERLGPGDICTVRTGVYRETLRPARSGEPGRPITIRAFPGERPLLHGADLLTGWRDEKNGLWSAPLGWDLHDETQLFAGETLFTEARWPVSDSLFEPLRGNAAAGTTNTLTDPTLAGDAQAWTGALLWCAGGSKWICWAARVTAYDPETHTLTFDPPQKSWYTPIKGSEYVLMGTRASLTVGKSWWFDRANGRVWLLLPPGIDPQNMQMAAKARRTLIDLRGRQFINLAGFSFIGGGILTDVQSSDLRLDGLKGSYLAHSYLKDVSRNAVYINGTRNVVINSELAYSSGSVLMLVGRENAVVNCHIHHGNYGALWAGAVSAAGRRQVISHNTIAHSGRDLISVHGLMESLIEYNDLSCAGALTHDVGITYGHNTDFAGTEFRYNLVHDNKAKGYGMGIYFDHLSHNVLVHHNVLWNLGNIPVLVNNPGYFNLIAHNSAWNTRTHTTSFDHSRRDDLYGTRFLNNLFNFPFNLPSHVMLAGNVITETPGYVAPESGNFTLQKDSAGIGKGVPLRGLSDGPVIDSGALPFGSKTWRAGHDFAKPIVEIPAWHRPQVQYMNQIVNAAFEFEAMEGWSLGGTKTAKLVPGNGWGNNGGLGPVEPTGTNFKTCELGAGANWVEQTTGPLRPRTRYCLSSWVKATEGATFVLEVLDPQARKNYSSNGWVRVEVPFVTGETAGPVTIRLNKTGGGPDSVWCDNVGLVEVP